MIVPNIPNIPCMLNDGKVRKCGSWVRVSLKPKNKYLLPLYYLFKVIDILGRLSLIFILLILLFCR